MAYEYQNFATLGVNLNRQKYGALDISQVFTSQADLNYYISKGTEKTGVSDTWLGVVPYPYAGQYLALVDNETREVAAYILVEKEDGNFECKEVGKTPVGDGKTIEVDAEGKISIKGVGDLASNKTYQLVYKNGILTWAEPDNTTVEGLQASIAALNSSVETINGTLTTHADGIEANKTATETNATNITAAEGKIKTNADDIAALTTTVNKHTSDLADRYTKSETDSAINTAISQTTHLSMKVVTEVSAATITDPKVIYLYKADPAAAGKDKDVYEEYMLIDGVITKIGDTSTDLSNYATKSELTTAQSNLEEKITAADTKAVNAQSDLTTFKGDVATTYETKEDATAKKTALEAEIGKKAALESVTALEGRVDIAEDDIAGLKTADTTLSNRIKAIEDKSPEANYIKSVNADEFTVTEGKLDIKAVAQGKVTGLAAALADKVSTTDLEKDYTATADLAAWVETNRDGVNGLLSADQLAKLNGIATGAQVNEIENIGIEGASGNLPKEDKKVAIPKASETAYGVVMTSSDENGVQVNAGGKLEVNEVNVTKLSQTDGDWLILDGGNA